MMDSEQHFDTIAPNTLQVILTEYSNIVPDKLANLDVKRYEDIPARVAKRRSSGGDMHLSRDEVATLVDWKLSHGKFRPTLKALVAKNGEDDVRDITKTAFTIFANSTNPDDSIKCLSKLKGVGPATASLLLSVCFPERAPFFSDELFRWTFWEDRHTSGWDRPIKYTAKEYAELYAKIKDLQQRYKLEFDVACSAVDVEKAAYVLGKHAANVSSKLAKDISQTLIIGKAKRKAPSDVDGEDFADKKGGRGMKAEQPLESKSASSRPTRSSLRNI